MITLEMLRVCASTASVDTQREVLRWIYFKPFVADGKELLEICATNGKTLVLIQDDRPQGWQKEPFYVHSSHPFLAFPKKKDNGFPLELKFVKNAKLIQFGITTIPYVFEKDEKWLNYPKYHNVFPNQVSTVFEHPLQFSPELMKLASVLPSDTQWYSGGYHVIANAYGGLMTALAIPAGRADAHFTFPKLENVSLFHEYLKNGVIAENPILMKLRDCHSALFSILTGFIVKEDGTINKTTHDIGKLDFKKKTITVFEKTGDWTYKVTDCNEDNQLIRLHLRDERGLHKNSDGWIVRRNYKTKKWTKWCTLKWYKENLEHHNEFSIHTHYSWFCKFVEEQYTKHKFLSFASKDHDGVEVLRIRSHRKDKKLDIVTVYDGFSFGHRKFLLVHSTLLDGYQVVDKDDLLGTPDVKAKITLSKLLKTKLFDWVSKAGKNSIQIKFGKLNSFRFFVNGKEDKTPINGDLGLVKHITNISNQLCK